MRIAVASLLQETNTFSPQPTTLAHFQITEGKALLAAAHRESTEVKGFIDVLAAARIEAVPLLGGWAVSYGRMAHAEFVSLVDRLLGRLEAAGRVDGLLIALHGAWAAESVDSADGYVLARLRERLGPEIPIVVSLDLHANLSRSMSANADAIIGYRTCPHVDTYETGVRAGKLLLGMISGKNRPIIATRKLPMAVQAEEMMSDRGVFKRLLDHARAIESRPGVLSCSIFACQPWLDVEELGWACTVTTESDRELAEQLADELAGDIWSNRRAFVVRLPNVNEALDQALGIEGGPVTLGEGADGTMGGSPGDSVFLLAGLLERKLEQIPTAAVVVDPAAVAEAIRAGEGNTVTLWVGGKLNPAYAKPVRITGKIKLISDGEFRYKGRVYTGRGVQMGRAVVVEIGAIRLLIAERSMPTTDPEMYRSHGIEPCDMKLVFVKSPLGLRTEYEPISKAIISVDTPGCCRGDLLKLPFRRIPRPMFPFDDFELPKENHEIDFVAALRGSR